MDTASRKTGAPRIEYPESALHMMDVQNAYEQISREQWRLEQKEKGITLVEPDEPVDLPPHRRLVSDSLSKLTMGSHMMAPASQLIVVHLTGLPRESMMTSWGLVDLIEPLYEWRIAHKPTTAALLAERLPFLREYIRTRTQWMIAYIENDKQFEKSEHNRRYIDDCQENLRRQLAELDMTDDLPKI